MAKQKAEGRRQESAAELVSVPVIDHALRTVDEDSIVGRATVALVSIELPIGEFNAQQNRPAHIEARLSPQQGRALQRLKNGLDAKYGSGWRRGFVGYADVLRWLLDRLPS